MHYLKEKICYKEGGTSTNIDNENDENNAESKNINEYNNVEDAPTKGSENLGRGNDQAEDDKETNKRLRGNDDKDINNLGSKKIKQTDISEEDNKNDMEEKCDKLNIIDKNGEIEKSINYKNYAISNKKSEKENFYSEQKFEDLDICDALKKGLKELNFITLTEIQSKCIPHFLNGKDILGAAKTGSGKTLAFLVPSINILYNIKFLPKNGTGVLIISPTRELCLQIYQVCTGLCKYIPQTNGIIIGGVSRNEEKKKFIHGINILIATPGRLLDHMQNTKEFNYKNLLCLIIDEADRLLQIGFEEEINLIVKRLPKKRQTALFSATQVIRARQSHCIRLLRL